MLLPKRSIFFAFMLKNANKFKLKKELLTIFSQQLTNSTNLEFYKLPYTSCPEIIP